MSKLFHISDLHIRQPYTSFGEKGRILRETQLETFIIVSCKFLVLFYISWEKKKLSRHVKACGIRILIVQDIYPELSYVEYLLFI